jgi:hypothetical protein
MWLSRRQVHYPGRENRSSSITRAGLPIVIAFPGTNFNVTYILYIQRRRYILMCFQMLFAAAARMSHVFNALVRETLL